MGDHRLNFELDHESFDPQSISSQSPSQFDQPVCAAPRRDGRHDADGRLMGTSSGGAARASDDGALLRVKI